MAQINAVNRDLPHLVPLNQRHKYVVQTEDGYVCPSDV